VPDVDAPDKERVEDVEVVADKLRVQREEGVGVKRPLRLDAKARRAQDRMAPEADAVPHQQGSRAVQLDRHAGIQESPKASGGRSSGFGQGRHESGDEPRETGVLHCGKRAR
jgi:hypothetical protein